jgi:glycosyltransferase involved in cell wall biosynthesis
VKTPLLSICIATYNRASHISETLDSIIPQLNDDIELLVVDGASTDNTEDVLRKYSEKEYRIRYIRLSSKGGVDQDYDKSVELARGEFCWLFTDDDLLRPGAVAAVTAAINEGHVLIVVNAEVRNRELSVTLQSRRIVMHDNKVYAPTAMECLFVDALDYLSFIGAVVMRRSVWLSRERESYFGTEFVHVGVIFQKPLPGTALIIAEPYISIRYGNGHWTSRRFDIWMFKWPKLVWSFAHISDKAKRCITRKEPWRSLIKLILQRGRGAYTTQHYLVHLSELPAARLLKFSAWLISRLPIKTLACLLYYYGRLTRINALILFDFKPKGKG